MLLLDLLPEIVFQIFETIVLSDDVDLALYIRVVCKRFDGEVIRAICNTRMLDKLTLRREKYEIDIPWRNERLFAQYLIMRTTCDISRKEAFSKMIGETVDCIITLCPQDSFRREEYVRALCYCTAKFNLRAFSWVLYPRPEWQFGPLIDHMLAAVCYLDLHSLFPWCLDNGAKNAVTFFGLALDIVAAKGGSDIIINATTNGHTEIAEMVFQTPKEFKWRNRDECLWKDYASILEYSARAGQLEACQYLVHKIASMTTVEDRPACYQWYSSYADDPEYLKRPVIAFWYDVMLYESSKAGHETLVRCALENGADANIFTRSRSSAEGSALEGAARFGHHKVMKILLANGANMKLNSDSGSRALDRAIREGYLEVVLTMVEKGYSLNRQHGIGYTFPVLSAVKRGQIKCLELLLKLGLKVDITQGPSREAYEYAIARGYSTVIRLLQLHTTPPLTLLTLPSEL